MKSLVITLLIITIALDAVYSFLKLFVYPPFGPLAIFTVCLLSGLSIFFATNLVHILRGNKQIVLKLWLFIGATFITYLVAEVIISFFLIHPLSPPMVSDPFRHHKFVSNTQTQFKSSEYRYIQTINNLGLRGPDVTPHSSDQHFKILMLGDSFTMGKGVNDDQTFSALLENHLNNENYPVIVWNAGVDSYSPILSYFQLTRDLSSLKPNLVILNLDMSDLIQETAYRKRAAYGPDGEIQGIVGRREEHKPLKTMIRDWVDQHLYITRTILFFIQKGEKHPDVTIENVVIRPNAETLKHTLAEDNVDRTEQWNELFDSILKIKRYCDHNHAQFLLTIYPWGHQVNDKEWNPGRLQFIPEGAKVSDKSIRTIQELANKNHIELLNAFPAFRAYRGNIPLYFKQDMHWTKTGHELMARELENYIRATYMPQK
jgi:lysophospholipase L1-like esterase